MLVRNRNFPRECVAFILAAFVIISSGGRQDNYTKTRKIWAKVYRRAFSFCFCFSRGKGQLLLPEDVPCDYGHDLHELTSDLFIHFLECVCSQLPNGPVHFIKKTIAMKLYFFFKFNFILTLCEFEI